MFLIKYKSIFISFFVLMIMMNSIIGNVYALSENYNIDLNTGEYTQDDCRLFEIIHNGVLSFCKSVKSNINDLFNNTNLKKWNSYVIEQEEDYNAMIGCCNQFVGVPAHFVAEQFKSCCNFEFNKSEWTFKSFRESIRKDLKEDNPVIVVGTTAMLLGTFEFGMIFLTAYLSGARGLDATGQAVEIISNPDTLENRLNPHMSQEEQDKLHFAESTLKTNDWIPKSCEMVFMNSCSYVKQNDVIRKVVKFDTNNPHNNFVGSKGVVQSSNCKAVRKFPVIIFNKVSKVTSAKEVLEKMKHMQPVYKGNFKVRTMPKYMRINTAIHERKGEYSDTEFTDTGYRLKNIYAQQYLDNKKIGNMEEANNYKIKFVKTLNDEFSDYGFKKDNPYRVSVVESVGINTQQYLNNKKIGNMVDEAVGMSEKGSNPLNGLQEPPGFYTTT